LKKSASDVLARHCRLTVSAAFTDVPCDSLFFASRTSLGLACGKGVLARWGWAGENEGLLNSLRALVKYAGSRIS